MKKSVYIRYEKNISASKEELKKGIEEDKADEYEVVVLDSWFCLPDRTELVNWRCVYEDIFMIIC